MLSLSRCRRNAGYTAILNLSDSIAADMSRYADAQVFALAYAHFYAHVYTHVFTHASATAAKVCVA